MTVCGFPNVSFEAESRLINRQAMDAVRRGYRWRLNQLERFSPKGSPYGTNVLKQAFVRHIICIEEPVTFLTDKSEEGLV